MRIFAIGRNYAEHIKELSNERPDEPVIFTKPDTALIRNNGPFYYPSFSKDVHYEAELVLRISKEGKNIDEKFASKYYDAIGICNKKLKRKDYLGILPKASTARHQYQTNLFPSANSRI